MVEEQEQEQEEQEQALPEGQENVSVKWLATKLGYTRTYISILCKEGRIKASKPLGGNWVISREEVDKILTKGLQVKPGKDPEVNKIKLTEEQRKQLIPDPPVVPGEKPKVNDDEIALPFLKKNWRDI